MKRLLTVFIILLGGMTLITESTTLAMDSRAEKVEAISLLFDKINNFYLHDNARDFLNNFYTTDSIQQLQVAYHEARQLKTQNWESELPDATLEEMYQVLHAAVTNLSPLMMRRGEAVSFGEELNFRSVPAVETQVLYRLPYGTPFEIIEEVTGGSVTFQNGVSSDLWFRIRHNDQSGFVHSWYVRAIPISQYRVTLLANIARDELWIESLIEGWHVNYALPTITELQEILSEARSLQIENWQFDLSYEQLHALLERLTIHHLNLVTASRYRLINDILNAVNEIENNVNGTGNHHVADYTVASWQNMIAGLTTAQALLIENWQELLSDTELEEINLSLRSSLSGLERIPPSIEISEMPNESDEQQEASPVTFGTRLRQFGFIFGGFIALIVVFQVVKRSFF